MAATSILRVANSPVLQALAQARPRFFARSTALSRLPTDTEVFDRNRRDSHISGKYPAEDPIGQGTWRPRFRSVYGVGLRVRME